MALVYCGKLRGLFFGLLLLSGIFSNAVAQPLEDVSLEFQNQGVVATIKLSGPVQYLRHFPESHGKTLEIYYTRVKDATNNEAWLDNEVRRSPPSNLIPSFAVTTRDQQTNPRLVVEFSREAEYSVAAGKDNRSLLITIRPEKRPVGTGPLPLLPTIKPEATAAPVAGQTAAAAALAETNKQAHALMVLGRDALAAKNNDAAVEGFNKLLLLPPNDYTQDGQEWVGVARERAGQPDKAKVEYELYLRLYPEGEGAARVAQRLEGLAGKTGASPAIAGGGAERKEAPRLMSFGSVSSRYYFGRSKIATTNAFNGVTTTDNISMTDQSMLITSVDASERYRTEDYDSRLVFRDVNTRNFLSKQPSLNRVNAAYAEIKGRTQQYLLRAGRQSAMGGGVLGRFDGLAASYGDAEVVRGNVVGGNLVDYSQGPKPRFFGASVDRGGFSVYGITQALEGLTDRRAVGAEYRYFDDRNNAYTLLDYDTYFKAVNAAQFMGMTKLAESTLLPNATVSFMLDHRKTPSLSIRNALNGATTSSVAVLQQSLSASALRELALSRTATSNMGQVGITFPFSEKWQIGGDFRLTNTTGMGATGQTAVDPLTGLPTCQGTATLPSQGCVQAIPGRGLEKSLTGQVIGSGLYKEGDIWSGSVTYSTSGSVKGNSIFLYNQTQYVSGWMMDTSLQRSSYSDQFGGTTTQIMPMLRGAYRITDRFSVDGDLGYQRINYNGTMTTQTITRFFGAAGLRLDF